MDEFTLWSDQVTNAYLTYAFTLVSRILKMFTVIIPKKKAVGGMSEYEALTNRYVSSQDPSKTIICVDFRNLLLEYSDRKRPGFTKLEVPLKKSLIQKVLFWQDVGYYYKKRIRSDQFLRSLKRIPNTILYLYTSEYKHTADLLIEELSFTEFFPPENRFYNSSCKIIQNIPKKHPAYLDAITGRVIILTSDVENDCDDSNESSRYFFEVPFSKDDRTLLTYASTITETITKNKTKEYLLDELEEAFVNIL